VVGTYRDRTPARAEARAHAVRTGHQVCLTVHHYVYVEESSGRRSADRPHYLRITIPLR